ncbi:Uma2 family endonuclease [Leptothoe kymatousa]|uniref:Uma2 family endonuclease n=1 Tax=Leptothoe kymatousa TAU-MAC 1615 TaxID=2364775 RepID=A0ABS5Y243_9CYAN|nr:Uma2 family endonuclease [Leptothoe kymatousa]MBT9311444.1 Uma2 family endonuclease [Leptothoe kymatousa TAU-MAC 1615]
MSTLHVNSFNAPLAIELPTMANMTEQDFIDFCLVNRELRIERTAQGKIIVTPPAFSDTSHSNGRLVQQLFNWADKDGTGIGFESSGGFTLPNGATRSPDAAWITLERWNQLSPEEQAAFVPLCPDFVIELRSSSDTLKSLQEKMQEYLDNGLRLGFLIDRKNKTVYVYRPDRPVETLKDPDVVPGDPELPDFTLAMAKIW